MSENKKKTKPAKPIEKAFAALPKEIQDSLKRLELEVQETLKKLGAIRASKPKEAMSAEKASQELEKGVERVQSQVDTCLNSGETCSELESELKRLRSNLPVLILRLRDSVDKGASSIYARTIKALIDALRSALRRLRETLKQ